MISSLIHVPPSSPSRSASAHACMTSLKAASIRTCSPDRRSVRCSRDGTWKVSSGITPRGSGEYHEIIPDSSAIGNQPLE